MWRILFAAYVALAIVACGPRQAAPLSTTPAADGGPSPAEAATLTAVAVSVLPTRPPPSETARPIPTAPPTATTNPVGIRLDTPFYCTPNSIGYIEFKGTVTNTGRVPLAFVKVKGTMRWGNLVAEQSTYIDTRTLQPGQSSSWNLYVKNSGGTAGQCSAEIEDYQVVR